MGSTKKYDSWHFGAKSRIGVDAGTGLVHSVEVTPANVHDSNAATQLVRRDDHLFVSDSGCIGLDRMADEFDRRDERRAASIRQKVEYVFHVVKDIFRFRKLPCKGIAKNRTRLCFPMPAQTFI